MVVVLEGGAYGGGGSDRCGDCIDSRGVVVWYYSDNKMVMEVGWR